MHSHQITQRYTIEAGEAITGKRLVDYSGKHTANKLALGVAEFDTDSGDQIAVIKGIVVVEAAGAISAGANFTSDANGKATSLTVDSVAKVLYNCGVAIDAASDDGDMIRVYIP